MTVPIEQSNWYGHSQIFQLKESFDGEIFLPAVVHEGQDR